MNYKHARDEKCSNNNTQLQVSIGRFNLLYMSLYVKESLGQKFTE